ncbi:MAG: hypothetical protein ACI3VP_03070, partial [Oscillospiraceae bacterium]
MVTTLYRSAQEFATAIQTRMARKILKSYLRISNRRQDGRKPRTKKTRADDRPRGRERCDLLFRLDGGLCG